MSSNDKNLKDMWNKTENVIGTSTFESSTIGQIIKGRSKNTAQKIRNMIFFDIALKSILILLFGVDIVLYINSFNIVAICSIAILLLILSIIFQKKMLQIFHEVADQNQNTRDNLSSMLAFLKTKFYSTLVAISATYIFVFIAGSLLYFYATYGMVRPLNGIDILVFLIFILFGVGINFYANKSQVKVQVKHLEVCLSDLNDNAMTYASENIELQRKQDRINKLLFALILVSGFLMLIAVLLNAFG
jgi:hypothetical protein